MHYTNICKIGNYIYERGYEEDGRPFFNRVKFKPTLFLPSNNKKTKYKALDGTYLDTITFNSIKETKEFIKNYNHIDNFLIYGMENYAIQYVNQKYKSEIIYNKNPIKILSLDIETECENVWPDPISVPERINAISMMVKDDVVVLSLFDYVPQSDKETHVKCDDEKELLLYFLCYWDKIKPDIITGWNIEFFDIPYLYNRISKILSPSHARRLSPYGCVSTVEKDNHIQYNLFGINSLDYYLLYKKYALLTREKPEDLKLDTVAKYELGDAKIAYDEYGSLKQLYKNNPQKFITYNIHDARLILLLEKKLKLIDMAIMLGYICKTNFSDILFQTRLWDGIIYQHLNNKNIIIPIKKTYESEFKDINNEDTFEGGFVKKAQIGMHKWVMTYDAKSLYPSIIMANNLGIDTLINKKINFTEDEYINLKLPNNEDNIIAGNGYMFSRKFQSFLSEIIENLMSKRDYYKERKKKYEQLFFNSKKEEYKEEYERCDVLQSAYKVNLNSAYGVTGSHYFRFFDTRIAEAVTLSGQMVIKFTIKEVNEYLNHHCKTINEDYVVISDTDSVGICFDKLVEKTCKNKTDQEIIMFLKEFDKQVFSKILDKKLSHFSDYLLHYKKTLYMKREALCKKTVVLAKKKYFSSVYDKEGVSYKFPKIEIKGVESVRSSTPPCCRKRIKNVIKLILLKNEQDVQKYIRLFENRYKKLPFNEMAIPSGVSNLEKYKPTNNVFPKHTPIHVRAAWVYNLELKHLHLNTKYDPIYSGDKVKYSYLKTPNIIGSNVIGIKDVLPKEFELTEFIDYKIMFQKTFLNTIERILCIINWNSKEKQTLKNYIHI